MSKPKRNTKRRRSTPLQYTQAPFRHPAARGAAQDRTHVNPYAVLFDILHSREQKNDLPWLTPQRAIELFEHWRKGELAPVQLVFDQMEEFDETLATVLSARLGALAEIPWHVDVDADAVGDDTTLKQHAEHQKETLTRHLNAIENLDEALLHLGMADFRGVAALEITGNPARYRLEPIEPWCLARPSKRGPWYYNPNADPQPSALEPLDPSAVIIREARPIDLPALFLIVAKRHAISAWDGFLDVFGSPSIFFEMPPATDEARAKEYEAIVQQIIGEGRGTVPNGGKFQTVETAQNSADAFSDRAKWCADAIITLAMGGLLTVSTAPDSGTLAGSAHTDSLARLTALSAGSIASCIFRQFCLPLLEREHPGELPLVRFVMEAQEREDLVVQGQMIASISAAGFRPSAETVSEIMGFPVSDAPASPSWNAPAASIPGPQPPITNKTPAPAQDQPLTEQEAAFLQTILSTPLDPSLITQDAQTIQSALEAAVSAELDNPAEKPAHPLANPLHALATAQNHPPASSK